MTALIRYEAARKALADARTVDEVKDIHDKAEAIRAYARMANDLSMEIDAAEIRVRAERKLGIMLASSDLARGGRPSKTGHPSEPVSQTLEEMGVKKRLSRRAQKVGGIAEQAFEAMVARMRAQMEEKGGRVSLDLLKTENKAQQRANKEQVLAGIQLSMPKLRFGVILADPEWRFEPWSRKTGMDRAADNHYPTSATEVIAARDVPSLAADDSTLWLWATVPMLPHALCVMEAWGFDYRSHFIWAKDRIGTGYWNRNKHELLLLGVRGKPPAPAPGTQWESLIEAEVGRHSAKPERFHDLIEHYYPNLPKIELNRRGPPRKGWHAWGLEAEPGTYDPETGELHPEPETDAPSDSHPEEGVIDPAPLSSAPDCGAGSTESDGIPAFVKTPFSAPLVDAEDLVTPMHLRPRLN